MEKRREEMQQAREEMVLAIDAGVVHGKHHEKRTDMRRFIADTINDVMADGMARARQMVTKAEVMAATKKLISRDIGTEQTEIFKAADLAKQLMGTMERAKASSFMEELKAKLNQGYRKLTVAAVEAVRHKWRRRCGE